MNICIFASELAVITGHNQYQNISDIILKLWKKNFHDDYTRIKTNIEKMGSIKFVEESNIDFVNRISKEEKLDINHEFKKCLESNNTCDLKTNKKNLMKKIESMPESKKKTQLEETINHITNTDFGTKNESKTAIQYNSLTNNKIISMPQFYKRQICSIGDFDWYIGGRVDGFAIIDGEKTIIEIKNRVNRLFYNIRNYEKVQIHAYMFIHELQKSQLVENLRRKEKNNINIINVDYDHEFWNTEVYPKIIEFIQTFYIFLSDDTNKVKLLLENI